MLPELFTQDPQRLARFEREAKLLASLNHPNIAAIHSFEPADDVHFLVLELVPGETLAERVAEVHDSFDYLTHLLQEPVILTYYGQFPR